LYAITEEAVMTSTSDSADDTSGDEEEDLLAYWATVEPVALPIEPQARRPPRVPPRLRPSAGEPPDIDFLLDLVDWVCNPDIWSAQKLTALTHLSIAQQPHALRAEAKRTFVQRAIERGIVGAAVSLIEVGGAELAAVASNFLGDFAFNSDMGAQAVLEVFDRVAECFRHIFETLTWENLTLLGAAMALCVNIAAACPSGHARLIPLVRPVCLQIIEDQRVSDKLRGSTILLLANLSTTRSQELRSLRVADALLNMLINNRMAEPAENVAESVIIFLHGNQKCEEMDKLMSMNVIGEYCVPIMEQTLMGAEFRGMYPHLLYSARLFQVLAQSREYAEALVAHERVVPLLLQVNRCNGVQVRVQSDLDGRRLALEALWSLTRFRLWPAGSDEALSNCFIRQDLPLLLADEHVGIRCAAAGLWAFLHVEQIIRLLVVGQRIEMERRLPGDFWRDKVLSFLFPFLSEET